MKSMVSCVIINLPEPKLIMMVIWFQLSTSPHHTKLYFREENLPPIDILLRQVIDLYAPPLKLVN